MKRFVKVFLIILSGILLLESCRKRNGVKSVNESFNENEETVSASESEKSTGKIDVDFTKMNYNIASGKIFEMMCSPEEYEGKIVRIKGNFFSDYADALGMQTYSVLIFDATACCQIGLQFIPEKSLKFPEDFPESLQNCEVTGKFHVKDFNGVDFAYIECKNFKF